MGTEKLSEGAKAELKRRGKRSVSPHDCRHTAVVLRLKSYKDRGMETQDALGRLRVYFGWTPVSDMPMHYARAYWLTDAADAMDAKFGVHVDALRDLDSRLGERGI
jgi:integrase